MHLSRVFSTLASSPGPIWEAPMLAPPTPPSSLNSLEFSAASLAFPLEVAAAASPCPSPG